MSKVLILSAIGRELPAWGKCMLMIEKAGHQIIDPGPRIFSEDEVVGYLAGVDALFLGWKVPLPARGLRHAHSLKIVAKPGIGVDHIDLEVATEEGIIICNTPGSTAECVADHLFGLMLALVRRLPQLDRSMREGKGWELALTVSLPQLSGKTIGVIGMGKIGRAVTKRAKGFGMQIVVFGGSRDVRSRMNDCELRYLSLHELLALADFVTLHVPLKSDSFHMIGERELQIMKRTAFLFNTSRGAVVDEKALTLALKNGIIAGAGLDVFETEPLRESELFSLENVLLTPHVAGASPEGVSLSYVQTVTNIVNGLAGVEPRGIVNPEVLSLPYCRTRIQM